VFGLGKTRLEILESRDEPVSEGFYVYVEVDDVNKLWNKLSKTEAIADPIATRPWKHRNFSIKDPAGYKVKFFSKTDDVR
jgi:uncharacterized glyoxalase superfamily protein PhnB